MEPKIFLTINKHSKKILIVLLFLSFLLYVYNLTGWLINDDEGGYLYQAWRISEGELPYRDFYSPKMPLFLFTGGLIFKLFTPSVFLVRMLTVLSTHLTAFFIFLIAKEIYTDQRISLLSSILYLTLNVVFFQARLFRPDAYMVLFSTIGLFLFIKAIRSNKQLFFLLAGIFFGIATAGFKLFGILPASACLGFFIYQIVVERNNYFGVFRSTLVFTVGFLGTIGIIFSYFYILSPNFFDCIFGHHFLQKPDSCRPDSLIATLRYVTTIKKQRHYWLIFITLPLLVRYLFIKNNPKKIFTFVAVTTPILIISPYFREIFRYLLYSLPAVVIVFSFIIVTLISRRNIYLRLLGILIITFTLVKVFIPSVKRNYELAKATEHDTLALAEYIKKNTSEGDFIVACYGSLPFYAKRKMGYIMAGVSQSAVDAGRITAARLIKGIQDNNVKMILLHLKGQIDGELIPVFGTDFGPYHLKTLVDLPEGERFMDFVRTNYRFLGTFNRAGQLFYIYGKDLK